MTTVEATTTAIEETTEEFLVSSSSFTDEYGACENRHRHCNDSSPSVDQQHQQSPVESAAVEPSKPLVWRKPWTTALVLFSIFCILWVRMVVIRNYWIVENFESTLPGLASSTLRKHSMRLHMTFGAVAMLCSPIQMVTPFSKAWKKEGASSVARNWYRRLHRYTGRTYVACAMLAFFFGQWFIILKKFALVGGYNMGLAFSFSGIAIAYFAYMAWKTAPSKNRSSRYTIEDHRDYAIRSFSQIIAPVLYRCWYRLMTKFHLYREPYLLASHKLVCDDRNVCSDYQRPFDAIYCWLYWISALVVAEVVIACLPRYQKNSVSENEITVPLLGSPLSTMDDTNPTDSGTYSEIGGTREESPSARKTENERDDGAKTRVLNSIGCLLAVLAATVTGPILYKMATSIVKKIMLSKFS